MGIRVQILKPIAARPTPRTKALVPTDLEGWSEREADRSNIEVDSTASPRYSRLCVGMLPTCKLQI